MRSNSPVLAIWTVKLDAVNGQNVVTRRVVESLANNISCVYSYPAGGWRSIPTTILQSMRLFWAVVLRRHEAVYIVCSRSTLGFLRDLLPLALSVLGYRVVVHVHGSDFPGLFWRRFVGPIARFVYRNCEIIVPSSHLLPQLEGLFSRSVRVCENFAIMHLPDDKLDQAGELDDFVVLWNSNLISSKGIRELVDGLRLLNQEGFRVKLVVLGKPLGDSECTAQQMRQYVSLLRDESWITVVGVVCPQDVLSYLFASDAVALPSTYSSECQPLSIAQAMIAGRLVLVTPTDALRATVGTYPAIFSDRNAHAIADALRPYVAKEFGKPKELDREMRRAQIRFSPEVFDDRIRDLLALP